MNRISKVGQRVTGWCNHLSYLSCLQRISEFSWTVSWTVTVDFGPHFLHWNALEIWGKIRATSVWSWECCIKIIFKKMWNSPLKDIWEHSKSQIICYIKTVWVWLDQIWWTVTKPLLSDFGVWDISVLCVQISAEPPSVTAQLIDWGKNRRHTRGRIVTSERCGWVEMYCMEFMLL